MRPAGATVPVTEQTTGRTVHQSVRQSRLPRPFRVWGVPHLGGRQRELSPGKVGITSPDFMHVVRVHRDDRRHHQPQERPQSFTRRNLCEMRELHHSHNDGQHEHIEHQPVAEA